jgi:hypothetical protein
VYHRRFRLVAGAGDRDRQRLDRAMADGVAFLGTVEADHRDVAAAL